MPPGYVDEEETARMIFGHTRVDGHFTVVSVQAKCMNWNGMNGRSNGVTYASSIARTVPGRLKGPDIRDAEAHP